MPLSRWDCSLSVAYTAAPHRRMHPHQSRQLRDVLSAVFMVGVPSQPWTHSARCMGEVFSPQVVRLQPHRRYFPVLGEEAEGGAIRGLSSRGPIAEARPTTSYTWQPSVPGLPGRGPIAGHRAPGSSIKWPPLSVVCPATAPSQAQLRAVFVDGLEPVRGLLGRGPITASESRCPSRTKGIYPWPVRPRLHRRHVVAGSMVDKLAASVVLLAAPHRSYGVEIRYSGCHNCPRLGWPWPIAAAAASARPSRRSSCPRLTQPRPEAAASVKRGGLK